MRRRTMKILLVIMTVVITISLFYNAGEKKFFYFLGFIGCVMLIIQIVHLLKQDDQELLVDKDEATEHYIKWMEKNRKISIPKGYIEQFSDETPTMYRFVFQWNDPEDEHDFYAPIEIYKFYVRGSKGELKIQLGHGRGKVTKNFNEIQAFILRDQKQSEKMHVVQVVNDTVASLLEKKLENDYGLRRNKEDGQ